MKNRNIKIVVLVLAILFFSGCGVSNKQVQTTYGLNEEVIYDNYAISCLDYQELQEYAGYSENKGTLLKVNFKLTNKNNHSVAIDDEKYFGLIDNENSSSVPVYSMGDIILEPGDTVDYWVIFDTAEQDSYKVVFYTNVVTNNIAFEIIKH